MPDEKLFKRAGEKLENLLTIADIRAFLEIDESVTGITAADITNWNTAYSWGNHASAGYLTALPSHTHPLSQIEQSGATSNQVPQWNGSAWVPVSISTSNIYTADGTITANRSLTLDTFTFSIKKASDTYFHVFNNGNIWIGTATPSDNGSKLRVNGIVETVGFQFKTNRFINLTQYNGHASPSNGDIWNEFDATLKTRLAGVTQSILTSTYSGSLGLSSFTINGGQMQFGNTQNYGGGYALSIGGSRQSMIFTDDTNVAAGSGYVFRSYVDQSLSMSAGNQNYYGVRITKNLLSYASSDNNSFNQLYINGTLTNGSSGTNNFFRGIYYDPTITTLGTAKHVAYQNTTGDFLIGTTSGSVSIGATTTINASAILQVTSTSKGLLPPRMTATQAEAIASPAEGLLVYATDGSGSTITSKGWWGYEGSAWVKLN